MLLWFRTKIKVCVMENKGSVAKMIEMKIAEGINLLLEHKSIDCLDNFKSYMLTNMYMCTCVCACSHIQVNIDNAHTYVQKHENFHMYAYGHICCVYVNKCTYAHVYV